MNEKCHFGVARTEIVGRTITPQGVAPGLQNRRFFANVPFPKSKKQVQRYTGFVIYRYTYIPRLSEGLFGIYELIKADKQVKITE